MRLTPGVTISTGDVVTRQTLADLVGNAAVGTIGTVDLDDETGTLTSQTEPPETPRPGDFWWDRGEQVLRCWHDVVANTGVSLWLRVGPDHFDVAALAVEETPFGAALYFDLERGDRHVRKPPNGQELVDMTEEVAKWEPLKVVGFNNTGQVFSAATAASNTWIAMSVAGLPWAWYPLNKNTGSVWIARLRDHLDFDSLISGATFSTVSGGFTAPRGETIDQTRGGLVYAEYAALQNNIGAYVGISMHRVVATDANSSYARIHFQNPRMGRITV